MLASNHDHEIPELAIEAAQAAYQKGNGVVKIRDELGPLFEDAEFVALYPKIVQSPFCPGL